MNDDFQLVPACYRAINLWVQESEGVSLPPLLHIIGWAVDETGDAGIDRLWQLLCNRD